MLEQAARKAGKTKNDLINRGIELACREQGIEPLPEDDFKFLAQAARERRKEQLRRQRLLRRALDHEHDAGDEQPASTTPASSAEVIAEPSHEPPCSPDEAEAAKELFGRLALRLRKVVGDEIYDYWLAEIEPVSLVGRTLLLRVPTDYHKAELEERFRAPMHEELRELCARAPFLRFVIRRQAPTTTAPTEKPSSTPSTEAPKAAPDKKAPTFGDEVEEELRRYRRATGAPLSHKTQNVAINNVIERREQRRRETVAQLKAAHERRQLAQKQPQRALLKGKAGEG